MNKDSKKWVFNFGPIGRTGAAHTKDSFNLASLPLHVMLDALMASTNRDEFVEWIWHDLFKPAFYFPPTQGSGHSWRHVPGKPPYQPALAPFAKVTGTSGNRVIHHHDGLKKWKKLTGEKFSIRESQIMEDQVRQVLLGVDSRYVQLSFAAEPSTTSMLVRAVVADAFIAVVTRSVARSLRKLLSIKQPYFKTIRFVFDVIDGVHFSNPPTDNEIWNKVGQHFDIRFANSELILNHVTPIENPSFSDYATEVLVDLTGRMPTSEEGASNVLSLSELLVMHQDSRTLILTIPQPSIQTFDLNGLSQKIYRVARHKLNSLNAIVKDKDDVDYLKAAFEDQIEVREVPNQRHTSQKGFPVRLVAPVLERPGKLLEQRASSGRECRLCGSAFGSRLLPETGNLAKLFSADFTDGQYLGQTATDVCPLCRLYILNSPGAVAGKGKRKVLRGSFAIIIPTSHFGIQSMTATPIEQPPLDISGRFQGSLDRVTVTTQEFTLFQQISRRIVAQLWRRIEPKAPLPLPYLGAILLTHENNQKVRQLLPEFRALFQEVLLRAYPYEIPVSPSVEIALDTYLNDSKHVSRHTYLKARSTTLPISPTSRLHVLLNNSSQIELSAELFAAVDQLTNLLPRSKNNQQEHYWLSQSLLGSDPISATYEAAKAVTKLRPREEAAFGIAERYWKRLHGAEDLAKAWSEYEISRTVVEKISNRFPFLFHLMPLLRKNTNYAK